MAGGHKQWPASQQKTQESRPIRRSARLLERGARQEIFSSLPGNKVPKGRKVLKERKGTRTPKGKRKTTQEAEQTVPLKTSQPPQDAEQTLPSSSAAQIPQPPQKAEQSSPAGKAPGIPQEAEQSSPAGKAPGIPQEAEQSFPAGKAPEIPQAAEQTLPSSPAAHTPPPPQAAEQTTPAAHTPPPPAAQIPQPPQEAEQSFPAGQALWKCPTCSLPCWYCERDPSIIWRAATPPSDLNERPGLDLSDPNERLGLDLSDQNERPGLEAEKITSISASTELSATQGGRKRAKNAGLLYLGPKQSYGNDNFADIVLGYCNVDMDIQQSDPNVSIISIFGKDFSFPFSTVYLYLEDTDCATLKEQLGIYLSRDYDETALIILCNEYIVRNILFVNPHDPEMATALRRSELRPLKPGPLFSHEIYAYSWDIVPDITYMLSVNLFSRPIRQKLKKGWSWILAESAGIAPYLTIEFKCAAKSGKRKHGENQIAAASVVWLFQRKQIRDKLGLDYADLKHYSIVIMDASYFIFEATYDGEEYLVKLLAEGDLRDQTSLKRYAEWSNAIHAWGLGPHAASIRKDVELLLEQAKGITANMLPPPLPAATTSAPALPAATTPAPPP